MRANPVWCVVGLLAAMFAAAAHAVAWWVRFNPSGFGSGVNTAELAGGWEVFGNLAFACSLAAVVLALYSAEPVRRYGLSARPRNPFEGNG